MQFSSIIKRGKLTQQEVDSRDAVCLRYSGWEIQWMANTVHTMWTTDCRGNVCTVQNCTELNFKELNRYNLQKTSFFHCYLCILKSERGMRKEIIFIFTLLTKVSDWCISWNFNKNVLKEKRVWYQWHIHKRNRLKIRNHREGGRIKKWS